MALAGIRTPARRRRVASIDASHGKAQRDKEKSAPKRHACSRGSPSHSFSPRAWGWTALALTGHTFPTRVGQGLCRRLRGVKRQGLAVLACCLTPVPRSSKLCHVLAT